MKFGNFSDYYLHMNFVELLVATVGNEDEASVFQILHDDHVVLGRVPALAPGEVAAGHGEHLGLQLARHQAALPAHEASQGRQHAGVHLNLALESSARTQKFSSIFGHWL